MSKTNSVGLTKTNYEQLKLGATKRGLSMQKFLNNLVSDFGVADDAEKVVLSVPCHLVRSNKEELRHWLNVRVASIVKAFYPENLDAIDS
jgi:hypothetical protein